MSYNTFTENLVGFGFGYALDGEQNLLGRESDGFDRVETRFDQLLDVNRTDSRFLATISIQRMCQADLVLRVWRWESDLALPPRIPVLVRAASLLPFSIYFRKDCDLSSLHCTRYARSVA